MKDIVYNIIKSVQPSVVPEKFEDFDENVPFSSYELTDDDYYQIEVAVNKEIGRKAFFNNYLSQSSPKVLEDFIGYAKYINVNLPKKFSSSLYMTPIAIIGMGIRLPGAINTPAKYWNAMATGRDCLSPLPTNRHLHHSLRQGCPPNELKNDEHYIHRGGFYDVGPGAAPITDFDPTFFNISPFEAKHTEPKFRWIYETVYEAFQDACIDISDMRGSRTGIYCTVGTTGDYLSYRSFFADSKTELITGQTVHGSAPSSCAGRIAFNYGFIGPADTIDTACSSGLTDVNNACKALSAGDADLAIVSAAHLQFISSQFHLLSVANMASRLGRCATFDESADGYAPGEGCISILLKRLDDAVLDNDRVYGVITGVSTCQSGIRKSISAPAVIPQRDNLLRTMAIANVRPEDVDYVEAHGTGTPLGDSIETQTLNLTFGGSHTEKRPLVVGSVKTNIGHTEEVSGIAGLCKVALAMSHRTIPQHLHLKKLNPLIDLSVIPMTIPQKKAIWKCPRGKKRIGVVSSFGLQGSIANAVLEEFKLPKNTERGVHDGYDPSMYQILTISGKNKNALIQQIEEYISIFETMNEDDSIADICYSSNIGRQHFAYRYAALGRNASELIESLTDILQKMNSVRRHMQDECAFSFTGQGNAKVGMGKHFYTTQPVFRKAMDRCDAVTRRLLDVSIVEVLYNLSNNPKGNEEGEKALKRSSVAQPALFAYEYAMSELWCSWGIKPSMVLGHSLGEIVAVTIAGGIDFELAMEFIIERASCMEKYGIKPGSMVSIFTTEEAVKEAIEEYEFTNVSIAAINGTTQIVISGDSDEVRELEEYFTEQDIKTKQLNVTEAFHSSLMEPAIEKLYEWIESKDDEKFRQPLKYGLVSNVTGKLIAAGERLPKSYWGDHARNAVQFVKGVETLLENSETLLAVIEVGPAAVLTNMSSRILRGKKMDKNATPFFFASAAPRVEEEKALFDTVSKVYNVGADFKWKQFHKREDICTHVCPILKKTNIPLYPFQRSKYWGGPDNSVEDVEFSVYKITKYSQVANNMSKLTEATPTASSVETVETLERYGIPTVINLDDLEKTKDADIDDCRLLVNVPLCTPYVSFMFCNHVVNGLSYVPAVAYIDFVFHALKTVYPSKTFKIDEFFIINGPLSMYEGSKIVLIMMKNGNDITVYSQTDGGKQEPRISVIVSQIKAINPDKVKLPFDAKKDYIDKYFGPNTVRNANYGDGDELYKDLDKNIKYGNYFRSVDSYYAGEDQNGEFILGHIKYDADMGNKFDKYALLSGCYQVGIMDACIHSVGGRGIIETKNGKPANEDVFLPASFEGIKVYSETIPSEVYVLHQVKKSEGDDKITSYWVFDKQGKLVLSTDSFMVRKFDATKSKDDDGFIVHTIEWEERPAVPVLNEKAYMIVVRDHQGYAEAFEKQLKAKNVSDNVILIDMPKEGSAIPNLVNSLKAIKAKRTNKGVLALYNFSALDHEFYYDDNDTNEQMEQKIKTCYMGNLELMQAFIKTTDGYAMNRTICFVTMGASTLNNTKVVVDKCTSVYDSLCLAVAKSVHSEFLDTHTSILDLELGTSAEDAASYCTDEILGGTNRYDMPFNIAYKDGKRMTCTMAITNRYDRYEDRELAGNILITGGLGGISMDTVKYIMKTQGDKIDNIFLLGRKEEDSPVVKDKLGSLIKYKEENGKENCKTNIVYYSCDISDKKSLASVFDDIRKAKGLKINGIFHTAGTNNDAFFLNQSYEKLETILPGKVYGAHNLLTLTEEFNDEIDFILLLSSLSASTGLAGQANYVAANRFMDALASYERYKGRKNILSCDLAGWQNAGGSKALDDKEYHMSLSVNAGTALLQQLFTKIEIFEQPIVICTPICKRNTMRESIVHDYFFKLHRPNNRKRSDLSLIMNAEFTTERADKIKSTNQDIADILKSEVKRMLMYNESDEFDAMQPLSELGIDSIMMMEVRQIIRAASDINVPLSIITAQNVNLQKLINYVKSEVNKKSNGESNDSEDEDNAQNSSSLDGNDSSSSLSKRAEQPEKKKKVSSILEARKALRMKKKAAAAAATAASDETIDMEMIDKYGEWFVRMDSNKETKNTLFLFPAAASSVYMYRDWSKYLKNSTLLGVSLPGHLVRLDEEPIDDISVLVKFIGGEIIRLCKEKQISRTNPIYFCGHSFGALLAYETILYLQQLSDNGEKDIPVVKAFICSGSPSPTFPRPVPIRYKEDGTPLFFTSFKMEEYPEVLGLLGGANKESMERNSSEFKKLLPSIRADFVMTDAYKRSTKEDHKLQCDLYIIGGTEDKVAPESSLKDWCNEYAPNSKFVELMFEGGHWFIQENVEKIANQLSKELDL